MKLSLAPVNRLAVPYGAQVAGLQALKIVCTIMVVFLHTGLLGDTPLESLTRIAVPVFYMITGFFIVDDKGLIPLSRIVRSLKKLVWFTLWVQCVYFLWTLMTTPDAAAYFNYSCLKYAILIGDGWAWHLWYLNALVYSLIIMWCAVKWGCERLLTWFIPVGIAANLLLGTYAFVPTDGLSIGIRRGIFTIALPCVMLGVLLRRRGADAPLVNELWLLLLAAALVAENAFVPLGMGDISLLTIPLAVAVFIYAVQARRVPAWAEAAGVTFATGIYVWHLMAVRFLRLVGMDMEPLLTLLSIAIPIVGISLFTRARRRITAA